MITGPISQSGQVGHLQGVGAGGLTGGVGAGGLTGGGTGGTYPKNPLRHSVAQLTGYHKLLGWEKDRQHLLPGPKHAFPQHPPPRPPQGNVFPLTFTQQKSPIETHTSPQQLSPPAHWNGAPSRLWQVIGVIRRRVSELFCLRKAKSELSSLPHSPSAEHSSSPSARKEPPRRIANAKICLTAMSTVRQRCDSPLPEPSKSCCLSV